MPKYHFDIGNSSEGHIGMCAVVEAADEDKAVRILCDAVPEMVEVAVLDTRIVYLHIYINGAAIKTTDIDDEET